MEENNAVNATPDVAPAPAEPTTQTPAAEASPAPAETGSTQAPEIAYDEAVQKYLDNQNIKGTPTEVVAELVKRNQQLRSQPKVDKAADAKAEIAEVLTGTTQEGTPPAAPTHTLSDVDIMTTAMLVEREYPDVKVSADFYKQMIADGINPMNGQEIALNRVLRYAALQQKLKNAEKAVAEAQQPAGIPSPTNTIDDNSPVEQVKEMTQTAAENIVVWSRREQRYGRQPHPQYQEAVNFLQKR